MMASCHGAMVPLAVSLTERLPSCGLTVVTVNAGFGAAAFLSSAAPDGPASSAINTTANAEAPANATVLNGEEKRFMWGCPMMLCLSAYVLLCLSA